MNFLVLSVIVILISSLYERLKRTKEVSKGTRWFFYTTICFLLCLFAGLRTRYNDTVSYIVSFSNTPKDFSSLFLQEFSISEVYLFKIWNYIIYNFISQNENVYLFLCAIVSVFPSVYLINKYSKNFTFSMILFMFGGMYLFSLAGIKQAMATGIVMMALPSLFKRKYFKYYLYCILSLGFHTYSLFFLILPLLGNATFNKRTIYFCIAITILGLTLSYFSGAIKAIIEFLGKDISVATIGRGSVNILRAIVFFVPFVLSVICRKKLETNSEEEKWFVKISIMSSVFMILAMFGNPVLFGRIPQYFIIGIVVSMPLLIEKAFAKNDQPFIYAVAIICYVLFGIYGLYIDSAFTEDIFGLIWF